MNLSYMLASVPLLCSWLSYQDYRSYTLESEMWWVVITTGLSCYCKDCVAAVGNYQSAKSLSVTRQMYGGFLYTTNAYFLALDTEGSITTMYIIRVCNDGQLAARYELQLTCGGALSISSVITGVSEVSCSLVVSVDGRVCSYNLATIDTTLHAWITTSPVASVQDHHLEIVHSSVPWKDVQASNHRHWAFHLCVT